MLTDADISALQTELTRAFRQISIESDVVSSVMQKIDVKIDGAPDPITMLFAQDVVIQAGAFTTEAFFDGQDFSVVREALVRMARDGYHARKPLIGISSSRFGEARRSTRPVLISRAPWPEALINPRR